MRRLLLALALSLSGVLPRVALAAEPSGLVPPKLVTPAEPVVPKGSEGTSAKVVLTLTLDKTGKVTDAVVATSSGVAELDAAALEAAKRLVFEPATRDGAPIPAKIPYTFRFEAKVVEAPKTGAIRGVVRSADESPLAGATVTVIRVADSSEVARSVTSLDGSFRAEALPPGKYRVAVALDGFLPFSVEEDVTAGTVAEVVYRPKPKPVVESADAPVVLEVKGERPPREVTRRTLEAEEIKRLPGTNGDALRSIESLPGVARPPSFSGLLIVRGSGPNDTGIFIDGTQVPLAYHFGGLVSVVPSEVLDRIDFYPGNYGVQYGRLMGGIVDVGLRSPKKDGPHGLLQVDLLDARTMIETPITDRARVLVAARRSWIDTWLKPVLESTGTGVSTAPVYYDGQLIFEYDLNEKSTARLAFVGSSDKLAITLNAPSPGDPIAGGLGFSTQFWRLQGRVETRVAPGVRWTNMLSYGQDIIDIDFGSEFFRLTTKPLNYRSDFRAKLSKQVTAIAGIDMQWTQAHVDLRLPPIPAEGEAPSPFFARPPQHIETDSAIYQPAAYALLDIEAVPGVKLLPGVRVDWTRDTKQWNVSPRIALRWDAVREFPRTTIKGGAGLFYQPPQPYEDQPPYGSTTLSNNRAVHYSAGFEQEITRALDVSFEGFYKDLRNLVVQSPAAALTTSGVAYDNAGSGRTYGTELLVKWKNDGRLFGWIAYTLSRSERRDAPGEAVHLFQYDQTHIFTALASYKLGRGWQVGARFRYVTGTPYTPYAGGIADYDAGAYAALSAPLWSARDASFHRLDIRVDKTWQFKSWSLSAYLDVQNAYNRKNPEGQQYNYNYSQSQPVSGLPILPIIGLRGEL